MSSQESTIVETFATLRIFSVDMHPDQIGNILSVEANGGYVRDPAARARTKRETNHWSWTTEGKIDSIDNAEHLESIVKTFSSKREQLEQLRQSGCSMDICCFMVTTGQGGPSLDVGMMTSLSQLGLSIWWDVYFASDEE